MNIQSIAGLRLLPQNYEARKQNFENRPFFGLKMTSPLSRDAVSFKATPKGADKTWEVSKKTARTVRKRLQAPAKRVFTFIDNTFNDLIANEKYPKNPLTEVSHRLKSDTSIAEKTGSRKWISIDEIVEHMTDLIGAKLVLRESNKARVDAVLDRFIPLIKSGKVELLEIENKRPMKVKGLLDREAGKYDYASIEFLNKMADIQNDVWKKGGKKQKVKKHLDDDFTDANYCAIHFLFRLPGKNPATFELQVLGNNVNEAKHIDDIVWKKLNGKNSADSNPEFDKLFEPFANKNFFEEEPNAQEIVENAKAVLNEYRGQVFLVQRDKEPRPYSRKKKTEAFFPLMKKLFPSDIEIKYKLSSDDYDFNNLNKILQRGKKKKVVNSSQAVKTPKTAKTAEKKTSKS